MKIVDMIEIPGGTFHMGDTTGVGFRQELPVHEVTVSSFFLGQYAVTVQQYYDFILSIRDSFKEIWCDFIDPCFIVNDGGRYVIAEGAEQYPMVQVSYAGAIAFCNWLSEKEGLESVYDLEQLSGGTSRNGYRLPTEAEWEYACGGSEQYPYGYGTEFNPSKVNYISYEGEYSNKRAAYEQVGGFGLYDYSPMPVGTLSPNSFGLYEMVGNVNEWCHDIYAPFTERAALNPVGACHGSFRVIKGGSFMSPSVEMRKSFRHAIHPHAKCMIDGFRIAKNKK